MVDQEEIKKLAREFVEGLNPIEGLLANRLIKSKGAKINIMWGSNRLWDTDYSNAPITRKDKIDRATYERCIESIRDKEVKIIYKLGGIFGKAGITLDPEQVRKVLSAVTQEINKILDETEIIELKKGDYEITQENKPPSRGRLI